MRNGYCISSGCLSFSCCIRLDGLPFGNISLLLGTHLGSLSHNLAWKSSVLWVLLKFLYLCACVCVCLYTCILMCWSHITTSGTIYLFWNMIHHWLTSSRKTFCLPPAPQLPTRNVLPLSHMGSGDQSFAFLLVRQALHQLNYLPRTMGLKYFLNNSHRTLVVADWSPLFFSFTIPFPGPMKFHFIRKTAYVSSGTGRPGYIQRDVNRVVAILQTK